ncbi:hypothetical protein [Caulobacter sp. 17J65-9]|uniref:hypothetical protein n=1 Tax=Caulobacter sp. 17J65-9 TaxID=2709382 RepID=UPI0013CB7332|nr:hypothetical protein [Caulobacter sp. 17J65-9]NEX94242.1 hypothetical protein [Caulobacter sp. 17J65-9]
MAPMLAAAALAALLSTAAPTTPDADEAPPCFDVALVARVAKQKPGPFPDDPVFEFTWSRPWRLDLDVEQVLIGGEAPGRLPVTATLSSKLNPHSKHALFFLKRRTDGGYDSTGMIMTTIVSDARGRFVKPVEDPLREHMLYPNGWVPASYEQLLRPIRYRAADAWWLQPPRIEEDVLDELDPAWVRRDGRGAVARRGLFVDDWMRALKAQPGAVCPHD